MDQTHKIQCQKISWHRGISPCVSACGQTDKSYHWHCS